MEDMTSNRRPTPLGGRTPRKNPSSSIPKARKLPSPVGKEGKQQVKKQKEQIYEHSSEDDIPTKDTVTDLNISTSSPSKTGVAYITETLIKKLTREETLGNITALYLVLGKDLNKKFKYIENLENLPKLQVLHISNHTISKIEKLDKLTQLRELNLAKNNISKIEGLENLTRLQKLNLSRNEITHLPGGLMRKLKELQVFYIAHNNIESLLEVTKLRPLQDLTDISIEGNPMSELAHSRQFVIFQLRSLVVLDGKEIAPDERAVADDRFGQDEIRRLEAELLRQENLYDTLFEEKRAAMSELDSLRRLSSQQKESSNQQVDKIKKLERELNSKEEILVSKTAELSKACEKQYKLEQELAFYKLDAKFDHLGKIPWPEGEEFIEEADDEAPYIGKAGFKPNKFAHDFRVLSPEQKAEVTDLKGRLSDRYDGQNKKAQNEIHEALMLDLQQKEAAVLEAEGQLAKLDKQLKKRLEELRAANDELALIQQAIEEEIKLLDNEDKRLLKAIADKNKYIRQLQEAAADLERRMNKIHDDLRRREEELNQQNNALNTMSPGDPGFDQLKLRLAETQDQLRRALKEYDNLKREHEATLKQMHEEMAELQRLQDELVAKRREMGNQGQLKAELNDIINELNNHLDSLKQKVDQQAKKIAELQRDKEGLVKQLKQQQEYADGNAQLKTNMAKLQQHLKATQDALAQERATAEALRRRLSELEGKVAKGNALEPLLADTKARLKDAETEVERLRKALDNLKQQMKADRQAADERIRREQEKVERALQAAKDAHEKDKQSRDLGIQVDTLKAKNKELEARLKELEDDLKDSFSRGEVLDRLNDLRDDVDTKRSSVREPFGHGDELGEALADLHQRYLELLEALKKERQGDKIDKNKVDDEIKGLNARIENLQNALKQAGDRANQLEDENQEKEELIERLQDDLSRLKDALARQGNLEDELSRLQHAHDGEIKRLKNEVAKLKDRIKQLKNAMEREVANARAPLEDKIKSLEDRLEELHNRLAKAKAEADRLKALHGDHAASKRELESKLAALADELEDAYARAQRAEDEKDNDKLMYKARIQALEDELARANDRMRRMASDADKDLERERQAGADTVEGLEAELERLRGQLAKMRQRAKDEADKIRNLEALRAKQMQDEIAALRDELQRAQLLKDDKLRKADQRNAALQTLLNQQNKTLQDAAHRDAAHQLQQQSLQNQIDGLRKMLSDADKKAATDKYEKDLEALRAEQRRMAAQATAAKDLADAQKQIARLQAYLTEKDKQLQEQAKLRERDSPLLASQRDEISNLASALNEQNAELERLKADLNGLKMTRVSSFHSLADEIEALRAALRDREREINALAHHVSPVRVTRLTGPPVTGSPVVFTNGLTDGEVHYHHHFQKSQKDTRHRVSTSPKDLPRSPTLLASSAVDPMLYGASVHHHHYDGLQDDKSKRRKKKEKAIDDIFCNVPEHGDLEYEVGLLEGMLTSTQQHNIQDQQDSLRSDLQQLEDEVQSALRSRAATKRSQQHSLDATLANPSDRDMQTQTEYQSPPGHSIPQQYLQQSSVVQDASHQKLSPGLPLTEHDERTRELSHIESILRSRRMELHDVTAGLLERRKELDAVTEQCTRSNGRLRRAEEDASSIEKRASETSKELVNAGNQLLNLEVKTKASADKLDLINQEIDSKNEKLREIQKHCSESSKNVEKVDEELRTKISQLEKTEKSLTEVEEKLKLSLKLSELREVISTTEKVENEKTERRLIALKDGEKILVERTSQLARTRNELQKQTAEYHELSANISLARKDLNRLELAVKNKNIEIEELAARREEEKAYHENILLEAEDKFQEITEARNNVLLALRKNRDDLLNIRENIQTAQEKQVSLEQTCNAKDEELIKLSQKVEEKNILVETLNNKISEKVTELNQLEVDIEDHKKSKEEISSDVKSAVVEYERLQECKNALEIDIHDMKEKVHHLQSELLSNEQLSADTMTSLEKVQEKLHQTENETAERERIKDLLMNEINDLKNQLKDCKVELDNLQNQKDTVLEELHQEHKKLQETKSNNEKLEAELNALGSELEKRQKDLRQELEKEKNRTEPSVNEDSGKSIRHMRRKRQGAQLPIPTKARDALEPSQGKDSIARDVKIKSQRSTKSTSNKRQEEQEEQRNDGEAEEHAIANEDDVSENVSEDFQVQIQELTAEKDRTRQALKTSVLEVNRLKTQIEKEKANAQSTVDKVAAEANDYRRALGNLKKEFAQYQLRSTRDIEYLRAEAAEQFNIAQSLAREITTLKQQSLHEKKDDGFQDLFTRETMDAVATQIKSEIVQSLREVEQSREDTIKDIDSLKQAKEEIENQLVTMQQSLIEAKENRSQVTQKTQPKHTQEESRPKSDQNTQVLVTEQGYLREQLRKQMTRRADILDEERRKAGQSLEGLKRKLKQLEKVITRKDSTVQDFRLELAKTRLEKERTEDREKELEELRRRLQDVESERDTVKTERDHLATLANHMPNHVGPMTSAVGPVTSLHDSRSYSKLQKNDSSQFMTSVFDEENMLSALAETLRKDLPTRNREKQEKRRQHLKEKSRTPTKKLSIRDLDLEDDETFTRNGKNLSPSQSSISVSVPGSRPKGMNFDARNGQNIDGNFVSRSDIHRKAYERFRDPIELSRDTYDEMGSSNSYKNGPIGNYTHRDKDRLSLNGPLGLGNIPGGKVNGAEDERRTGLESRQLGSLSISSIAEDKKTKFMASVTRLKNEKLRELEIGLQEFLKQ